MNTIKNWIQHKSTSFLYHIKDFSLMWILLFVIFLGVALSSKFLSILGLGMILWMLVFSSKPLNIIYGLIGTSGSIQIFFLSFITISFVFSAIYFVGFFQHAYISYDINQPHVHFVNARSHSIQEYCCDMIILDSDMNERTASNGLVTLMDTTIVYANNGERLSYTVQPLRYQRITYSQVLRNTIITSLISEPSDLFAAASAFNQEHYNQSGDCIHAYYDKTRSGLFHWILILQILISWILLGVFISILYNKFRYES